MARKLVLQHPIVINQSLTADFIASPTVIKYLDNISYQINILTSDSVGSFEIQASDDYQVNEPGTQVINPGNWVSLNLGGTPSVNMANDVILISLNEVPFSALRVKYTATTPGTGTSAIYINCKSVGA